MRRKWLVPILIIVFAMATLLLGDRALFRHSLTHAQLAKLPPPQDKALPEHVPYSFLFHHLVFLKQRTDEFQRQGKGKSSLLTRFQEDAKLSAEQFQTLYQIASDCEQQVAEQDKKAMVIINEMKARYPDGKLPMGEAPPSLPPELIRLQQDRDLMILRARDRLRAALGEQAFVQFHSFVQQRVGSGITPDLPQ